MARQILAGLDGPGGLVARLGGDFGGGFDFRARIFDGADEARGGLRRLAHRDGGLFGGARHFAGLAEHALGAGRGFVGAVEHLLGLVGGGARDLLDLALEQAAVDRALLGGLAAFAHRDLRQDDIGGVEHGGQDRVGHLADHRRIVGEFAARRRHDVHRHPGTAHVPVWDRLFLAEQRDADLRDVADPVLADGAVEQPLHEILAALAVVPVGGGENFILQRGPDLRMRGGEGGVGHIGVDALGDLLVADRGEGLDLAAGGFGHGDDSRYRGARWQSATRRSASGRGRHGFRRRSGRTLLPPRRFPWRHVRCRRGSWRWSNSSNRRRARFRRRRR